MGLFTLGEAREEIARLRPVLDQLVIVRADVVELAAAVSTGRRCSSISPPISTARR
jgi:hypothetical protein